jgi:protein-disulfide isomerase/transcription elongation factor Elf1
MASGPEECPLCDRQFSSPGALKDHAWETHTACHYCGEQLEPDEQHLYKHWLAAHSDELRTVDERRATDAVDSMTVGEQLEHGGVGAALGAVPRRYVLLVGGTVAAGGVVAGGAMFAGGLGNDGDFVSDAEYARFGESDADATITYYGNYKCPFCADFSTGFLRDLIREYVDPGSLEIVYRNVAYLDGQPFLGSDAPAAGSAGLAVYDNEPESWRDFHDYVFENQPPESQEWATPDRLSSFAAESGVEDTDAVETAARENRYRPVLEDTDAAAREAGIEGTPALVIGGTAVNPLADESRTRTLIEDAISSA